MIETRRRTSFYKRNNNLSGHLLFQRQDSQQQRLNREYTNQKNISLNILGQYLRKKMNSAMASLAIAVLISIVVLSQAKSICNRISPINIPFATFQQKCAPHPSLLGGVVQWRHSRRVRWKVTNTGDGIKINLDRGGDVYTLLDNGDELRVNYMMLKWGSSDSSGSDHAIDRSRFAAELQIYHHKHRRYGIQAFAFLIKERHNPPNLHWNPLLKTIRRLRSINRSARISSPPTVESILSDSYRRHRLPLSSLARHSFRYQGTSTNGKCKSVSWSVFPLKLHLSSHQLRQLRSVEQNANVGQEMLEHSAPSPSDLCMYEKNSLL